MPIPVNKTKIICTIGPASEAPETLERMILAGMNVARLNFSHGDFESHRQRIKDIRSVSARLGRRVAIMADLPGPKMRIGELAEEPIELIHGDRFTLTTKRITGDTGRVSVTFDQLPQAVKQGDILYLNDGFIQLRVESVDGDDVHCLILAGGELRSRKGLNLPGIDLGMSAFTDRDRECLAFALEHDVDAVSQSFVESAGDIHAVREAAEALGHSPFIIAKLERASAQQHIDSILEAADGIMIARGDLGVEIPIERMVVAQKLMIRKAGRFGKPVITATQMLESMTESRRPTRAEATDVANAILDGTDCVMLSGESAMGRYPVESVEMLVKIAKATESARGDLAPAPPVEAQGKRGKANLTDLIALSVEKATRSVMPAMVLVPTLSGESARSVARFRLEAWIIAVSTQEDTCRRLLFSYGVYPTHVDREPDDWNPFARHWVESHGLDGALAILTRGPSPENPGANHRMEIIDLENPYAIETSEV